MVGLFVHEDHFIVFPLYPLLDFINKFIFDIGTIAEGIAYLMFKEIHDLLIELRSRDDVYFELPGGIYPHLEFPEAVGSYFSGFTEDVIEIKRMDCPSISKVNKLSNTA